MAKKINFCADANKFATFENSPFCIIPFGYEKTTSYMKGTKNGPKALLEASERLEPFDEQFRINAAEKGVFSFGINHDKGVALANVDKALAGGKFPIILGGEHTITPMAFERFSKKYGKLNYLVFDAHADLKDEYMGSKWSHACATRRVYDCTKNIALVGIRSINKEESRFMDDNHIPVYYPYRRDMMAALDVVSSLDPSLPLYISFDLDGLDPSVMPGVGTPEPGGLSWYEAISLLDAAFKTYNVVGFDCVELMPLKGSIVSDFIAAKLVYKAMALKLKYGGIKS
jgi:agmatinase